VCPLLNVVILFGTNDVCQVENVRLLEKKWLRNKFIGFRTGAVIWPDCIMWIYWKLCRTALHIRHLCF